MNRKTYFIRSFKYLIWLLLLFTALFLLMLSTGTSRADVGQSLSELFLSQRGQWMLVVILILAAFYPRFGFTVRRVDAKGDAVRQTILETLASNGYSLQQESAEEMVFRASAPLKRILLLWEDQITVRLDAPAQQIEIDGIRKEVVRIEFRLRSFLGDE
ncbi:MAG: hypothetical protein PHV49_04145 [Alistipes sp.]|nr:hypothetical protein [Alistipes sp.]